MSRIYDQLRAAIQSDGRTRHAIGRASGISESHLSQLMAGTKGLSVDAVEKLAAALGLEILFRRKRRSTRKGR